MPPNVCEVCRHTFNKQGRDPLCDVEGICSKTKMLVNDEEDPTSLLMEIGETERIIVELWTRIINMSPRETVKKLKGKEVDQFSVPTLLKLEICLDGIDWDNCSISQVEAVYYIGVFHAVYLNNFIG